MRIGFFTSIEGWGGSETYLLSLMNGVKAAGHDPVLFGIEGTRLFGETCTLGVETVAWKKIGGKSGVISKPEEGGTGGRARIGCRRIWAVCPGWVKLLVGNIKELWLLKQIFKAHSVDVMHVSNNGYEVAGAACWMAGIPTVAMCMITPPPEAWWFRRWLMRVTLKMFDHVSSQSEFCTGSWIQFAGLDPVRCSFVWNGVDLDRFAASPKVCRVVTDPFRMVSVGRLHPMKGFDVLIDALALASDHRLYLEIVGEGDEAELLQRKIRGYGLDRQVVLIGYDEHPERRLLGADCFVLVSVSHESCPAVLPEAMACGLPLVTSDFGPLSEVNVGGVTGLVVPVHDRRALAEALVRLADNPELALEMGAAGRIRAALFDRKNMVQTMLERYHQTFCT